MEDCNFIWSVEIARPISTASLALFEAHRLISKIF